jgi:hypothetical protein
MKGMKGMKIMKTTMKNFIILWILSLTITASAQVITNGKRIHELPAKDTIKSDYLIIQGSPTTGKLYKTKMSVLNSAYSGGGGGSTDTSSLSNRIDKKLNKTDTSTLSTRINAREAAITATTSADYYRGDKTFQALNKSAVGLSNVDNTSDATKNSATSTLTNKTISGSANTFSNISESSVTNLVSDLAAKEAAITAGSTSQYWRGDKTWQTLTIPTQFNPIAGSNITLTGTYPNITIASSGGGGGGGGGETLDQTLALGNTTGHGTIYTMGSIPLATDQLNNVRIFTPSEYGTNATVGRWFEMLGEYQSGQEGSPTARKNVVYSLGYNIDQGISNEGYIRFGIESNYRPGGGIELFEWHAPEVMTRDGNINRWYSITGQKDSAVGVAHLFRGSTLNFLDIADPSSSLFAFDGNNWGIKGKYIRFISKDYNEARITFNVEYLDTYMYMDAHAGGSNYIVSNNNNIFIQGAPYIFTQNSLLYVENKVLVTNDVNDHYLFQTSNGAVNTFIVFNNSDHSAADMYLSGSSFIGAGSGNTSAKLEVTSTTKGFLPPRMTTTQKNAISSPAEGLTVYDNTLHKLYVYDGSTWQAAW